MSDRFTHALLSRRLARDAQRVVFGDGRISGGAARSWRDWLLFSIAYGIIVAAILFTAPHDAGGAAVRADGPGQAIGFTRGG